MLTPKSQMTIQTAHNMAKLPATKTGAKFALLVGRGYSMVLGSGRLIELKEALIYVGEAVSTRQKQAKKRSLYGINEHFEPVFNAVMTTQVINQCFLK